MLVEVIDDLGPGPVVNLRELGEVTVGLLTELIELNPLVLLDDVRLLDIDEEVEPRVQKSALSGQPHLPHLDARVSFDIVHAILAIQLECACVGSLEFGFVPCP